jgi:hypothetical protein
VKIASNFFCELEMKETDDEEDVSIGGRSSNLKVICEQRKISEILVKIEITVVSRTKLNFMNFQVCVLCEKEENLAFFGS